MAKPQAWSPDDFLSAEAPPAPKAFSPDDFLSAEPDREVPTGEGALRVSAKGMEDMTQLGAASYLGIAHYAGIVGDTVRGWIDPHYKPQETPQNQLQRQNAMFDTLDAVHKIVSPVTTFKPNESVGMVSEGIGGLMSIPAQVATWPKPAIDTYMDMKTKGASDEEMAKVLVPMVGLDFAAQVFPYNIASRFVPKSVTSNVVRRVTSGVGAGVINQGIQSSNRGIEQETLPDRPEFDETRKEVGSAMPNKQDIPGDVMQVAFGIMDPHAPAPKPRASPADQLRQAAELLRGETPKPAEAPVNYDIPPGQRGVERLPPKPPPPKEGIDIGDYDEKPPPPAGGPPPAETIPSPGGINVGDYEGNQHPEIGDYEKGNIPPEPPAEPGPARAPLEEGIQAAPAPDEPAEQIAAAEPPKSDRQQELERLLGLTANPEIKKDIQGKINAEKKAQAASLAAAEKENADRAQAAEYRRMAAEADDPRLKADWNSKADKLDPLPEEGPFPLEKKPAGKTPPAEPPAAPAEAPKEPTPPSNPPAGAAPAGEAPGEPKAEADPYTPAARAEELRSMAQHETGWAQQGGKIIRGAPDPGESAGGAQPVTGRTSWIPQSEWFGQMRRAYPKGASLSHEGDIQRAVEKAIKGEPLKAAEKRTVDHMMDEIKRRDVEDHAALMQKHGHGGEHVDDVAAAARLHEIDPNALERLAIKHQGDPEEHAYYADVRKELDAHTAASDATRAGDEPRPGSKDEKPAVRGDAEKSADMEPAGDALRDKQGPGNPAASDGTGAGSEVQPAGAERGNAPAAEAGKPVKEKPAPVVHPDDQFGPEPGRLYPKPDEKITPEWRDQVKEHIGKLTDDQVREDLARAERNIAKKESLTKADRRNIDPEKFKVDVEAKKEIRNLLKDELAKRKAEANAKQNPRMIAAGMKAEIPKLDAPIPAGLMDRLRRAVALGKGFRVSDLNGDVRIQFDHPERGGEPMSGGMEWAQGKDGAIRMIGDDKGGWSSSMSPSSARASIEAWLKKFEPKGKSAGASDEPFSLENPTPQTLKERDQVAKDAAAGQPPLLHGGVPEGIPGWQRVERGESQPKARRGESPEDIKKAWGVLGDKPGQPRMDATVAHVKAWMDANGLSKFHEKVRYVLDPDMKAGVAHAALGEDGKYEIRAHPDVFNVHPNLAAKIMLHEHGHVMDWNGLLYSDHPDFEARIGADGKMEPVGAVLKELVAAAKRDPTIGRFFDYPMNAVKWPELGEKPWKFQAEMFAQALVAARSRDLKEVLSREAPQTAKFIEDALAHAKKEGIAADNPTGADAQRLRDSFARSRSDGGVRGDGDVAARLREKLESPIAGEEGKQDEKEAKTFGKILHDNFRPAQLRRMAEAAREENAKLEKGTVDPMKGLASLPKEQREVMEFLQGRGYTDTALGHLLGSNYHVYAGVHIPERESEGGGLMDTIAKYLHPTSRGEIAEHQEGIMRANFGEMARTRELAFEKMKGLAKEFDRRSAQENVDFFDRMERGQAQPTAEMQKQADALRAFLDAKRKEVQDLGTGKLENFNENYMPHIYRENETAKALFSRRPLEGSKAFLMRRSIPFQKDAMRWRSYDEDGNFLASHDTQEEAEAANQAYADKRLAAAREALPKAQLEHEAAKVALKQADTAPKMRAGLEARDAAAAKLKEVRGEIASAQAFAEKGGSPAGKPLTPISANPVELALLKAREMDRYIAGQRIFDEMKAQGLASLVAHGEKTPVGYTKINDKIANGGAAGHYYAPDEAATLLNNHVSPGLQGNSVYDAIRGVSMALNGLQLGLSAYHLGFTTLDSMVSRAALANKQLSRGDVGKAAYNYLQAANPAQPFVNYWKGDKLLKAYLGKLDSPEMAPIVAAIQQAGGRIRQDDFYRNVTVNAFRNALQNHQWGRAARTLLPTVLDRINAPIFEHLVPRQKLGVFFDLAKDHMEAHPDEDVQTRTRSLGKLWDSVDNRMGQMVYDNVFWNHALKDGLMLSVRSVGWNLGTFRELGGGVKDIKDIPKLGHISDRTAYLIALPLMGAVYNAIVQQLYGAAAGKTIEESMPQSGKDLYYPRTFKTRADGTEDRVALPTYNKDMGAYYNDFRNFVKYGADPFQTLENKANPLISTVAQLAHDQDYFGHAIHNPADGAVRQAQDTARFLIKQFEPFAVRNFQQQQTLEGKPTSPFDDPKSYLTSPANIGVVPAPGYITKTDEQNESSQISRLREPLIGKFRDELAEPGADPSVIEARMKASGLSKQDIKYVLRSAGGHLQGRTKTFGEMPDESRP